MNTSRIIEFNSLDLSFNKITGLIRLASGNESSKQLKNLVLKVNRLSGDISRKNNMQYIDHVDILEGNMFSCKNLPSTDKSFSEYVCGSTKLDSSLYFFGVVVFILALLLAAYIWAKNHRETGLSVYSARVMEYYKTICTLTGLHSKLQPSYEGIKSLAR